MKPALGQSKEEEEEEEEEALGQSRKEEEWQDQTTHYLLPPSLSGNWGKKKCVLPMQRQKKLLSAVNDFTS